MTTNDPIKVGLIADLTGPLSFVGTANANVARMVVGDLNAAYADCIDEDRLEDWPDFFVDDCRYLITDRQSHEAGLRHGIIYGASKAALDHFLEALRNRLSRNGVTVVTIKPGFVDTDLTRGLPGLFWLISPDQAAVQILAAAQRGSFTTYVPWRWRLVGLVIRSIPSFIFRRMKI